MRSTPTTAEQRSVEALIAAFKADNHSVSVVERKIQDRPDALLEIDNIRIACECVQIPPAYIFRQLHQHHQEKDRHSKDLICSSWPNEPHQWMAAAVRKKTLLIPHYLNRTGASEAWLLVHTPANDTKFFINSDDKWLPWALRHGTKMVDHQFAQIHLWTPNGGIEPISHKENEGNTYSELGISFSKGYPTLNVDQGSFPISTTASPNDPPNVFTLEHRTKSHKVVEPLDREYAKHKPARRDAIYRFTVTAWSDNADIQMNIEYPLEKEHISLTSTRAIGLKPSTKYFHHYIYEYHAPSQLSTWHVIQPHT